ncbi:excinuclease ABC subunit UvrA [Rubripirellula amarantea]|uniref:UvrABC system protein A n=1 Tax=Rubripirellula amarantea TaxID=2527999 RepID=A0A5C5WWV6_9BACT|nr:excinuclease ABC subunit UvrA [Rubripirellula amarantea]MDA8745032.1 excinuclease ABC subunit UvrA [Rubripirellula amarantea]TWT55078.1 UvrABC system protein A [Rubripirellula amarantea]
MSTDLHSHISVRGCRVHNLKNIDVDVPRGKLIAICGLSGSGKTSLALDTLYAEGQRCYIESFSAYTRQFLQRIDKPDCDKIEGIPPAIAVTRAGGSKTNRSTVATATEIADHLRLLFSKAAKLFCYSCGNPVVADDPGVVADEMTQMPEGSRSMIGFPIWLSNRTAASEILLGLQQEGYLRLVAGGETFHLSDEDRGRLAAKVKKGGIEIVVIVDRVTSSDEVSRLTESLETAMNEGHGRAIVLTSFSSDIAGGDTATVQVDGKTWVRRVISRDQRCDVCDIDYPDPVPRLFNFNNPLGACPTCEGFGDVVDVDMDLVVPDKNLTLAEGALAVWNTPSYAHELDELLALADDYDLPVDVPFKKLKKKHLKLIQQGVPERKFGGLDGFFAWLERKKYKMHVRIFASRFKTYFPCPDCHGKRFKPEALAYRIGERNIADTLSMSADEAKDFFRNVSLAAREQAIADEPREQIVDRLGYLQDVGLGYLQLDRPLRTLSGGETQRVALTSALGSSLVNMLYVLDEPTAGLHPIDVERLSHAIVGLRDRGNTVIVVEHDETMIRLADHVIEIGPEAGVRGGEVTFEGTSDELISDAKSLTGQFLSNQRGWTLRDREVRTPRGFISLSGASGHNLKKIDVEFPLGLLCLVTGISGSGKSSLVQDTLYGAIRNRRGDASVKPLPYEHIKGLGAIEDCLLVDQSPISRSARSAPVTYVKAFDAIRKVFAGTVEARTRNLSPGHFSFNSAKGQCPQCEGAGQLEVDMQFLADVSMECPSCQGTRYRDEILDVRYRDLSIADVLDMSVQEAASFFRGQDKVQDRLSIMKRVGLDYIKLGQPATTLSSGEGQRLKLAAFLASASRRRTLFIMDEPTTGLHFADIVRLVDCFDALIDDGHSLLVVEHSAMLIEAADYIIDLGPGAAADGGDVVATGSPKEIAKVKRSLTGQVLRDTWKRRTG